MPLLPPLSSVRRFCFFDFPLQTRYKVHVMEFVSMTSLLRPVP